MVITQIDKAMDTIDECETSDVRVHLANDGVRKAGGREEHTESVSVVSVTVKRARTILIHLWGSRLGLNHRIRE